MSKLYTTGDIAKELKINFGTCCRRLQNLVAEGKIARGEMVAGAYLYTEADLEIVRAVGKPKTE